MRLFYFVFGKGGSKKQLNRKRNLLIGLLAAVLSSILVYAVYVLQLKQVEWQKTVQVVAPKEFIRAGAVISVDMLTYKSALIGAYNDQMLTDANELAGMEAVVPLGAGEPILKWKVDKFHLLPRPDESTFQIPKEYVLSVSNGIRAGDRVLLYVSKSDGESERLFPQEITVASVKSAANVEVENPKNPNFVSKANGDREKMYASRREANGAIEQINLNLHEAEWLTIDRLCKTKKAKLVIAFASSSITEP